MLLSLSSPRTARCEHKAFVVQYGHVVVGKPCKVGLLIPSLPSSYIRSQLCRQTYSIGRDISARNRITHARTRKHAIDKKVGLHRAKLARHPRCPQQRSSFYEFTT